MRILFMGILGISMVFTSCQKNSVTGRSQLILVSETDLQKMSTEEYRTFLSQHKVMANTTSKDAEMVTRVGNRIAKAVSEFAASRGKQNLLDGYQWEFHLVEDKTVNAWCMPGGKVVVYSGLIPVAENEDALAVVMGHEIAHAVAQHGNERMSQGLMQEMGGVVLSVAMVNQPAATQNLFMNAYGVGTTVGGTLPFSRKHELEADRYGLIFAAIAGYNPQAAIPFWERMAKLSEGGETPPEILSTHPSDANRIEKVKEYVKEAMTYYKNPLR